MSHIVTIRKVAIGAGRPKICVPLVASTKAELRKAAQELDGHPFDLVEWRIDFFEAMRNRKAVQETVQELRNILGDIPLLATVRTLEEGGNQSITMEEYGEINRAVIATGLVDLIDVEVFRGDRLTETLVAAAHQAGVKVIGSNHHFDRTPPKEELIRRLRKMQELAVDVVKIAVMPHCERDVLTLLEATLSMKEQDFGTPVVSMAMGPLGVISRLTGAIFGSAMTFGTVGAASAPGQISADQLHMILENL